MSKDLNKVQIIGRLTREPDVRQTQGGTSLMKLSIAVNNSVKRGDKWEDEVSFFDVTVWGRTAEVLAKYMEKGKQICVDGRLKQDRWEKDGQKHSKVGIVAENIQLLGGNSNSKQRKPQLPSNTRDLIQNTFGDSPEDFDSDIPF